MSSMQQTRPFVDATNPPPRFAQYLEQQEVPAPGVDGEYPVLTPLTGGLRVLLDEAGVAVEAELV